MANKKIQVIDFIFLAVILVISLGLIYFTWNLLKIDSPTHENTAKKKMIIQEDALNKVKNPSFLTPAPKSQSEGRINPFATY